MSLRVASALWTTLAACGGSAATDDAAVETSTSTQDACTRGTTGIGSATAVESGPPTSETSGSPTADLPPCVLELAYGRCEDACYEPGAYCPSGGDPLQGDYSVCAVNCVDVEECPPAPQGGPIVCHIGSCFLDCTDAPCPDAMRCIDFDAMTPHAVCMW